MGYSISQEQYEKLEKHRREGRLCAMSTGKGGCFNRATVRLTQVSWPYERDKAAGGPGEHHTMVFCGRHAEPAGYEGVNFTVLASERF